MGNRGVDLFGSCKRVDKSGITPVHIYSSAIILSAKVQITGSLDRQEVHSRQLETFQGPLVDHIDNLRVVLTRRPFNPT